jgi:tRNA threonylcarbamoyladenosine biosynthesis protein TsaB
VGLTTLTAYAAAVVSEQGQHPIIAAIDARHDHVYFQVVSGNGSSLIRPRVARIEEALEASQFGAPLLVGNAAAILSERWPVDAEPPVQVNPQPAPDIGWVAWLGAAVNPETAPARPYYLRAPDAKPPADLLQKTAQPRSP